MVLVPTASVVPVDPVVGKAPEVGAWEVRDDRMVGRGAIVRYHRSSPERKLRQRNPQYRTSNSS